MSGSVALPARMQAKALQLSGGRVVVRVSVGSPEVSPPVVLLHGIVSTRYLLPTARWLAQRRPVAAPDLPGFGASTRPRYQPAIGQLAEVLGSAIEEVGLTKPVLSARLHSAIGHVPPAEFEANYYRQNRRALNAGVH